ncbi:hypothetical protein BKA62DRAFT_780632 [Auriculariales sp. MPI-PUGE-AT-0066]|nr:hypothetical protein BKA62DRAFT_780632 [Auriculariales sp. MPI-PUGE-AT-0066]
MFARSEYFRDGFTQTIHTQRIVIAAAAIGSFLLFLVIGAVQSQHNNRPQQQQVVLSSARPLGTYDEEIVFTAIMLGKVSAEKGQYMVKSLIMHTSRPLSLHIMATLDARDLMEKRLALVKRPAYDVKVSFYIVTKDQIGQRARRAGIHAEFNDAGEGINLKLLIHEILPKTVTKAIYLDTDAFFLTDPYLIWKDYMQIPDDRHVSLTHSGPKSDNTQLCSCVMGLNLVTMRSPEEPFLPSTLIPGSEKIALGRAEVWNASKTDPNGPWYGDQSLYWSMWRYWGSKKFGRLPRTWNLEGCHDQQNMQLDAEQDRTISKEIENQSAWFGSDGSDVGPEGIFYPGILHFNCDEGFVENIFEEDGYEHINSWGNATKFVTQYKWVWLNRGTQDGSARLVTNTVEKPRFWDEVHAQEQSL